jgi:hypothetical protein
MITGEADRLAALHRYRILDSEPEQRFDDLALLASQICGTPTSPSAPGRSSSRISSSFTMPLTTIGFATTRWCGRSRTSGSTPGRRS